ncbi:transposase [uncultured Aeromicrobium sp.]|uniref:transposase n=1 Tax=uncultured Aeromicrobium sp. TaxID=337820 RepID=UPI00341B0A22
MTIGGWWRASPTGSARGIPWRDLPREPFGRWQTVWKRHHRYAADGTWDRVLTRLLCRGGRGGDDRLGGVDRCDDHARASARDEHHPP